MRFHEGKWTNQSTTVDDDQQELQRLRNENVSLRSENNMLKFKSELLLDMVALAELDDVHAIEGEAKQPSSPTTRESRAQSDDSIGDCISPDIRIVGA